MKEKKRGKKAGNIAIFLVLLALIVLIGYNVLQVRHVDIVGNAQFTEDEITRLAAIPANTEMLLVDEKQVKANIESNPYLLLRSLDYELPDTVALTIEERTPSALLAAGNSFLLLDRQLVVLKEVGEADAGQYPQITGITVNSADMGKQLNTDEPAKITAATAILDELKKQDLAQMIVQVNMADIHSIILKTKNGPDVLFGEPGHEVEKIAWIAKLLPDLISQGKTTGVLDVTAGTSATYGNNHMPPPSAQPTQSPDTQPTQSPGAQPTKSSGVQASAAINQTASASPSPKSS